MAAYKNGWEHDGWNTESDSETGLPRYTVTGNVTLYAVYRKDITVTFVDFAQTYKREGSMYNNDTYALSMRHSAVPMADGKMCRMLRQ